MIRGAFIFAVGLTLGYTKGLTDADKVANAIVKLGELLKDVAETPPADVDGTATETPTEPENPDEELTEGDDVDGSA